MHVTFKDFQANKCTKVFWVMSRVMAQTKTVTHTPPVFIITIDPDDRKRENSRNADL
jgi:hypothetical protein